MEIHFLSFGNKTKPLWIEKAMKLPTVIVLLSYWLFGGDALVTQGSRLNFLFGIVPIAIAGSLSAFLALLLC